MTHRRFFPLAAIAVLTLVLAACEITVTPGPTPTFPPSLSGTVQAEVYVIPTDDPPSVLLADSVGAQQTRYYRINVPTGRDLLYAETLGNDLRVTLFTTAGTTLAVSESGRYFGPNAASLTSAHALSGSALLTSFFCVGPCAAVEANAPAYVVGVRNLANSSRPFELLAYTMNATDLDEPNDSADDAVTFGLADDVRGAIEWLGDEDWFRYTGVSDETLRFTVVNLDLDLVLEFQADATVVPGSIAGTTTPLFPGDVFRVYSASGLAGPSTESQYRIRID